MGRFKKIAVLALTLVIFLGSFHYFSHTGFQQQNLFSISSLPLSRLSYQHHQVDWAHVDLDSLTGRQVIDYFRWHNRPSCRLYHDFGGWVIGQGKLGVKLSGVDGQKAVCIDPPSLAPRQGNCTVYSFGINNDWSFDDAMEQYGCQVYAFDPSMTEAEDEFDRSPSIHFYKLGLGSRDETSKDSGWRMRTLSTIYRLLNHEDRDIDYLKIDIEAAEWAVLPQIIESGMLARVRQMAIEFHMDGSESLEKYKELAGILRLMEDHHGMVRFDSKANLWYKGNYTQLGFSDSFGYEIAWYNRRFL